MVLGFDVPFVCHAEEVGYFRRLLHFVRNVDITSEYRFLDLFCFVDPMDRFNLEKALHAWWRELEFEGR